MIQKFQEQAFRNAPKHKHAFTLTELMVVLAVVFVLAGIFLPAYASTMRKAGIYECKNHLRQVGVAIDQYARDHTNSLPGPLWLAMFYSYQKSGAPNTPTTWSMGYHIAPYLGLPAPDGTPREVPALKCPSSVQAQPKYSPSVNPTFSPICYIAPWAVTNVPGGVVPDPYPYSSPSANGFWYPFGYPQNGSGVVPTRPLTLFRRPSEQTAMWDADQRNVSTSSTYYNYIPQNPVHNNRPGGPRQMAVRNYLFFDWSVRSIQTSN